MALALTILSVIAVAGIVGLAVWDGLATILRVQTISSRVQNFITQRPWYSVLVFAFLGFTGALGVHFEVAALNFWVLEGVGVFLGAVLGVFVRFIRAGKVQHGNG